MAIRLHDKGFTAGKRKFKLFSFSRLLGKYSLNTAEGTITFPGDIYLVISSPEMSFFLALINNLLTKNRIRLGKTLLGIKEIKFDEQVADNNVLTVRTLSPVVIYSTLIYHYIFSSNIIGQFKRLG